MMLEQDDLYAVRWFYVACVHTHIVYICMTAMHWNMCDLKQEATKSQAQSTGHQMVGRTTDIYVGQSSMALLLIN